MKTLARAEDAADIERRLVALTADDTPRWGVMNVDEMVCHLREPYRYAVNEEAVVPVETPIPAKVLKRFALGLPLPWARNLPTVPVYRIGSAGMRTTNFADDRAGLMEAFEAFCAEPNLSKDHPFFRKMDHADWMRWGWLHADHHLRQFGR